MEGRNILLQELQKIFRRHDFEGTVHNGWLEFGDEQPALCADLQLASPHSAQLDVSIALPNGQVIIESFAGLGESPAEHAFAKFVQNDFHTLLNALFHDSPRKDDQVEVEDWEIASDQFTVVSGPIFLEAFGEEARRTEAPPPPGDLRREIRFALRELETDEDVVWLRCFHAETNDAETVTEVLVDNRDWTDGRERLSRLPWQPHGALSTTRTFLVAIRQSAEGRWRTPSKPIQDPSSLEAVIVDFAARCSRQSLTELLHRDLLARRGVNRRLASRVIAFTPSAFARVLHPGFKFEDDYALLDDRAEEIGIRRLSEEPEFVLATELAKRWVREPSRRDWVERAAELSAESNVIEQFRSKGEVPDDLEFIPLRIFASAIGEKPRRPKPWWRFW